MTSAPEGPDGLLAAAAALKIVRGSVDEEELAALLAGVVAVASTGLEHDAPGHPASAWMDRTRTMRGRRLMLPLGRGETAWRNSLR
ncbi:acyl-CoA carboxylase subunit epsilon [Demequina sp.]|uniref:acyl-CoA carboxylase subunit epsilon n=1 Tax=Demequina sp. TaxID=2050685 RepID=UPI003D0B2B88